MGNKEHSSVQATGSQKKGKIFGLIVSLGISAACLGYLFSELDWKLFFAEFSAMELRAVPVLIAVYFATFIFRAYRWKYLLPKGLEVRALYDASAVGMLASTILPFRAGEVVRPFFLSRWQKVSFGASLASIVTERVFDVLALLFFLVLSIFQFEGVPASIILGAKALGALALVILLVMVSAYFQGELVHRVGVWVISKTLPSKIAAPLSHFLEEFIAGLRSIGGWKELLLIVFWSVIIWAFYALYFDLGLRAFGQSPSPWVGVLVCVCIALAIAAPSSPGFVGTFQFGCVLALTGISGYRKEFSLAYSVIIHAMQLVVMVLAGMIVLHQRGLSFAKLQHVEPQEDAVEALV